MSVTGVNKRPQGTFDALMEFKDAGLVATSAAAQVDSAAKVVDLGTGLFRGCMILEVSALEVDGSDEMYTICVQLSTAAAFANDSTSKTAVMIQLGHATPLIIGAADTVGRYKLYFDNENDGVFYRYARVYTVVAGTPATGINYTAYAVPIQ